MDERTKKVIKENFISQCQALTDENIDDEYYEYCVGGVLSYFKWLEKIRKKTSESDA